MGRPPIEIDPAALIDFSEKGLTAAEMADELGVSIPTLSRRLGDLARKQGLLLKYRELQHLHLTELQCRCLEAITPEKIDSASLTDLAQAFRVFKDKELVLEGKPTDIRGNYIHYLEEIVKQEKDAVHGGVEKEVYEITGEENADNS